MKLETKRRLGALIGFPLACVLSVLAAIEGDEKEIKELMEHRELFKARIFGKRLF